MVRPDRTPTDRMAGWMRAVMDYIGAGVGTIPIGALGGDGDTSKFLNGSGVFSVPGYPVAANPSASAGLSAVNGSAGTFMRSDAAPAINLGISPIWTELHTFSNGVATTTLTASSTMRSTGGFGCNGATPQTSYTVSAAIVGTAGAAYTATEQGLINSLITRVTELRAALVANGIAV